MMNARNPKYVNEEMTALDLDIDHPQYGTITFTASVNDSEQLGRDLFQQAVEGQYGEISPFVPETLMMPAEPEIDWSV